MAVKEHDPVSGYLTTGHEWNGITELNTPVPRPVYVFLVFAVIFSFLCWVLLPTWPLGVTYTKGLLGVDQQTTVKQALEQAALDRGVWQQRIETESYADIEKDPKLMQIVRQTGRTLFGDNCAACHGRDAKGQKGFPNLTTASWLWGGTPEAIAETIRVGINSAHADSRVSQMLAFGRDKILQPGDIDKVEAYVLSLSGAAPADVPADTIEAGKTIFAANCASCHGDDGKGKIDVGAPNLTDNIWISGSGPQAIHTIIWGGRQGHMPTWEARLSAVDRKILALYLADLRPASP